MYRPDHPPPHFHAQYGEHVVQIELSTLRVLNGSLPTRALRLVRDVSGHGFTRTSWRTTGSGRRLSSRWFRSSRWRSMESMLRVTDAKPLEATACA
ncbi:MAG: DUF4160 domain-containing protein [Thermoleophilaceae bacterium]